MAKTVIFAVAGSGKTTYIINSLSIQQRALLITYTTANYENIRLRIIRKFGYMPSNIKLMTYFEFAYNFCYLPLLSPIIKGLGLNFSGSAEQWRKSTDPGYYIDASKRLYSNRISKLFRHYNILPDINIRLEKYFDALYIDEVQDFGGNDFNFLKSLSQANLTHIYVGDFFQYTFTTSADGPVNRNLHSNYISYQQQFTAMGVAVDTTTLSNSYRCTKNVCDFISDEIGIAIASNRTGCSKVMWVDDPEMAANIYRHNNIVKLFYREHAKHKGNARNWGDTKGEDHYHHVCVVLNHASLQALKGQGLNSLPQTSKNKLYVACSRAKGHLFLIPENLIKN